MTKELTHKIDINLPEVPDIITGDENFEDGGIKTHRWSLADWTNNELEEFANEWTTALLARAEKLREAKQNQPASACPTPSPAS